MLICMVLDKSCNPSNVLDVRTDFIIAFRAFMIAAWTPPNRQKPINNTVSHDAFNIQEGAAQVPRILADVLHAQYAECPRSLEVSGRIFLLPARGSDG